MHRRWAALVAVTAVFLSLFAVYYGTRSRTWQTFGTILHRIETTERVVALTFDDGPTAAGTEEILAILAEKDARGTFFLIGSEIAQNPDAARRIVEAGHEVGNHSWSHQRMIGVTPGFVRAEIEDTDTQLRNIGFTGLALFRAPFCKKGLVLPWYLSQHNRVHVTFDIEPESDPAIEGDTKAIVDDVLTRARPGSIVLLHVMYPSRSASMAAVGPIVTGLRADGYELVTVSELLRRGVER